MIVDTTWDDEALDRAVQQAREATHRDPEAASLLIAQVINQQEVRKQQGLNYQPSAAYNPVKLYARMCRFYKGWTPQIIDSMHYLTFFAMVREANDMSQEEQNEMNKYNAN